MVVHCPRCLLPLTPGEASADACPHCGQPLSLALHEPTLDAATLAAPTSNHSTGEDDELIGTQLGNYLVEQFCGQGAMARVYRARHLTLYRPCALKLLSAELEQAQPQLVNALLTEARLAAQLVHPHVVTVHNIGEDRGYHFIEMEFVPGQSLKALAETTRLDITRATRFVHHICEALAEAHRQNLIHRDIKPSNVLVTHQDVAKLADFGLARRVEELRSRHGVSLSGTPNFMAPELWRGEPASRASDIYAVGITYFYLCTGRYPFAAPRLVELGLLHQQQPVPDVRQFNPQVPDSVANIINRCLAKAPEDRFANVEELLDAIHSSYLGMRSLESILHEALIGLPVTIRCDDPKTFRVDVALQDNRSQTVYVEECLPARQKLPVGTKVVRVYSPCGKADPEFFRRALELNADICFGALAVTDCCGGMHFVMVHTHPRNSCDPGDLRASIMSIAQNADKVEQALGARDVF